MEEPFEFLNNYLTAKYMDVDLSLSFPFMYFNGFNCFISIGIIFYIYVHVG